MASCRLHTTQAKQCRWYTKSWARRTTCVGGMPSWHAAHLVPNRLRDAQGAAQRSVSGSFAGSGLENEEPEAMQGGSGGRLTGALPLVASSAVPTEPHRIRRREPEAPGKSLAALTSVSQWGSRI